MSVLSKGGPRIVLVAALTLVAAVAGTAVAGSDQGATTSLSKKKTKKLAKKLDKKQDKKNFPVDSSQIGEMAVTTPKLSDGAVTTTKIGDGAVTGEKIGPGVLDNRAGARLTGTTGAATAGTEFGSPIEVTKSAAGGYCLKVPFEPKNVQALSTDSADHARGELTSVSGFGTCAASLPGYNAWVSMHVNATNAFTNEDFFVLIH